MKDISRYLDPHLLNLKNQPNKLIDPNYSGNSAGLWRNAYYLSTSIEDANLRKMAPTTMNSPPQGKNLDF